MENTLLKPAEIYTLGDYYKTPELREDCHNVKDGNSVTANDCAYRLAQKLPKDGLLIPVPSRSGYNEAFTQMLAYYANLPVLNGLRKLNPELSVYRSKKEGGMVITEKMVSMTFNGFLTHQRVILVDNVLATGTTASAAIRAIGKPCEMACIAVDYEQYNRE